MSVPGELSRSSSLKSESLKTVCIAVLISTLIPMLSLYLWDNDISRAFWGDVELLLGLAGGLGVIAVVGILDDLKGVSAVVKLGAQVLAASVAYFAGIHKHHHHSPNGERNTR